MRILLFSQYWHPENGVPQRRWQWLTKALVDAGHEVVVIAPQPHYARDTQLKTWLKEAGRVRGHHELIEHGPVGERVIRTRFLPFGNSVVGKASNQFFVAAASLYFALRRGGPLRNWRPDLVIGTVPGLPTAVITQFAAKAYGIPYLIDLRDAWPELLFESQRWDDALDKGRFNISTLATKSAVKAGSRIVARFLEQSLRSASAITTTSEWLSDSLCAQDLASGSVVTVRNLFPPAISPDDLSPHAKVAGELNVLYAGTIGRAQNLQNAVYAAQIAQDSGVAINMKFVGGGAAYDALSRAIHSSGLAQCELIERVDAAELVEYYSWADTALVHLTDWKALERAVPSKTYELASLGLFLTVVAEGEVRSLVEGQGVGVVVPPADPEQLAKEWIALARQSSLDVKKEFAAALEVERVGAVDTLLRTVAQFGQSNTGGTDARVE
ncbi:glycosyltransferase family 4 protein [Corynebacterium lizhenjunii]|uniref:glycosyltransferase family 4 protein n=1 Tax=Corynebacterium lizhenjunii TaxID=2709394 RepID=UPI0013ED6B39|nr:glycosyltransferase family 4 protein [Corynebacterium lizhenjunii]